MNGFCPEGYVPIQKAIVSAAEYWFAQELAAIMAAATDRLAPKNERESGIQRLALSLSRLSISDDVRLEAADIMIRTANKLRHFLHEGRLLKACYFGDGLFAGRHDIASEFWATTDADHVLESGTFFPLGEPSSLRERRLNYLVFLLQAELDALLSEPKKPRHGFLTRKSRRLRLPSAGSTNFPTDRPSLRRCENCRNLSDTTSPIRFSEKRPGRRRAPPGQSESAIESSQQSWR
jgi:hypothetical protein